MDAVPAFGTERAVGSYRPVARKACGRQDQVKRAAGDMTQMRGRGEGHKFWHISAMSKPSQILVFDRALVERRRARAAAGFAAHSVLFDETGAHLTDRLTDVKKIFETALVLGRPNDPLAAQIAQNKNWAVTVKDFAGENELLPVEANSFDLVISNLTLHWVNDLPGALIQIRNALKPNGLFLAALPGGRTLHELRGCLLDAELAVTGGISPRLSPTIELPTASALLQRAGFELPVTDMETIVLQYPDLFALMRDLRGMGETNAHVQRLRHPTRRAIFTESARLYRERHGNSEGRIPATFEIIFLHGWKS